MKRIIIGLVIFCATLGVFAQSLPKMKDPYVTDAADILTRSELKQLRKDVKGMCEYYSTRIVVGIVPTFDEYDIDEYAGKLAEKWNLSDENTMLILVKPKSDEERGEAMLLASSDLQDVFTNNVCEEIVHDEMIPRFKDEDYFKGIEAALEYMNNMSSEEDVETAVVATDSDEKDGSSSKFMEFFSNLGVGAVTIVQWILILIVTLVVYGVIKRLIIKKKGEEYSNPLLSIFSNGDNSGEFTKSVAEKKQRNNSDDDFIDNDSASSKESEELLKMVLTTKESTGDKIIGAIGKMIVGAVGIAGVAEIGKRVKERNNDGGLKENIGSFFKKKDKTNRPRLGGSGISKPKLGGGNSKPKFGSGKKFKLGGNSSSGGW